jgi:transposase-like protein
LGAAPRGYPSHHLGYEKGDPAGRGTGNNRNVSSAKTVLAEDGSVKIDVPRDRNGTFEPQIVRKGETRLDGFDDKIISLYARGMTVREIQGHLRELYAVDVSPDLISRVTDAVLDEFASGRIGRSMRSILSSSSTPCG